MNKNAIKKFAIEARTKLLASVTDKAGMLGITEKSCSEPITKGADFEVYQTTAGIEVTLNKRQCEQRRRLVSQIESRGFEAVVEEVAYTWFNRICAMRFMEVNDYLPNRVRVLSSEKEGKMEPDLVTEAPDVDLDLTAQEKEEIINWKLSGTSEDTDKLYCKLFLKQCHQLHDILPGLFEADSDYMELLFGISYTNKDDVIYMLVNPETGIPENDFNVSALDEEGNPTGQVEIIGWLYQYYNTELKDDTFAKLKKNVKITKERIPAATQLFTPDWIVRYMVENSVGRIWIEHLRAVDPTTDEKATAERFGWKYYLPEAEQEEEVNVKLAEIRTTYKDLKPTDITCSDPCMGSGHILIAMFDVLMDIYESAGYDKREAAFEIVEHNIHGLDIDQRAYQLAYFAVMMKGRGYNRRFLRGRDGKPEPKVYAITESNEINRNHLKFFGTHLSEMERNLAVMQIEGLLDTFIDAREYGSILNVDACDWDVLERFVEDALLMARHLGTELNACPCYWPRKKGKIERPFNYIEEQFIKGNHFASMEDLNRRGKDFVESWCNETHTTTKRIPNIHYLQEERDLLLPLPDRRYRLKELESRIISPDCYISIGGNKYSVPDIFAAKTMYFRIIYGFRIELYDIKKNYVMKLEASRNKHEILTNSEHYKNVAPKAPTSIPQIRREFTARYSNGLAYLEAAGKKFDQPTHYARKIMLLEELYDTDTLNRFIGYAIQHDSMDILSFKELLKAYNAGRLSLPEISEQRPEVLCKTGEYRDDDSKLLRDLDYYEQNVGGTVNA